MSKKYITKTHLTNVNGDLVAPGTEIEAEMLGDAATIKRYQSLEALEDSVIVTGEADDDAQAKAEAEAKAKAEAAAKAKTVNK